MQNSILKVKPHWTGARDSRGTWTGNGCGVMRELDQNTNLLIKKGKFINKRYPNEQYVGKNNTNGPLGIAQKRRKIFSCPR